MDRPLRIPVFVGTFPVISETFILRQITGLLELGHDVRIFADCRAAATAPAQPEVAAYRLLERTTFMDMPPEAAPWEMPVRPLLGLTWTPGSTRPVRNLTRATRAAPALFGSMLAQPRLTLSVMRKSEYGFQAESLSMLYRLHKLLQTAGGFDVLHAHFGPNGNSFRFATRLWNAPLVVSFHGYDFTTLPRKQGRGMYEKLFTTASVVTANSKFTAQALAALGCPREKIFHLPVGVNLADLPFCERTLQPGQPIRILTVARLVDIKGHEFALRAIAALAADYPSLRYDVIGDGPLLAKLEQLRAELRLEEIVTFHGARDKTFVAQTMAGAHIALLASRSLNGDQEGQGLFLQEAQASGLPVVATASGGLPEGMLERKSGLLAPEANSDALAARLRFLLERPEIWPAMGRAGRAFVEEHYDVAKLNRTLVQLYQNAAARHHKGDRELPHRALPAQPLD